MISSGYHLSALRAQTFKKSSEKVADAVGKQVRNADFSTDEVVESRHLGHGHCRRV